MIYYRHVCQFQPHHHSSVASQVRCAYHCNIFILAFVTNLLVYIYIKPIACLMLRGTRRFTASNRLQSTVTITLKPWWLNDVEAWLHAQTQSSQRLFNLGSCPSQAIEEALPECLPERSWRCSTSQIIHWTAIRVLQRLEVDLETTASASV